MEMTERILAMQNYPVKSKDIIIYEGLRYKVTEINCIIDYVEMRCMTSEGTDRLTFTCEEFIKATRVNYTVSKITEDSFISMPDKVINNNNRNMKEKIITKIDLLHELDNRYNIATELNGMTHKTARIGHKDEALAAHYRYLATVLEKEFPKWKI